MKQPFAGDPLRLPEIVAFAGDWHGNGNFGERAIYHCAEQGVDTIIHCGDFGYHFSAKYLRGLQTALDVTGIVLLFVDGNHENFPKLYQYPIKKNGLRRLAPNIWHLPRGFRWSWHGVDFLACGGAYSVDRQWRILGTSWWPEEQITDADIAKCGTDPVDVMVTHDCPRGVVIPGIDDRPLNEAPFPFDALLHAAEHRERLTEIVNAVRPAHLWHGHYHTLYQRTALTQYGELHVTGLDCDGGKLSRNIHVINMSELMLDKATRAIKGVNNG